MDLRAILIGTVFAAMWSSAFATARVIVAHAPPLGALSVRFLISGLLAVLVARALGQTWRLTGGQARAVILFGLCQNALYLGLNFVAMQWVEASLAVIIAASMPLMVAALGWFVWRERIAPLGIAGLVAGLLGVGLIMGTRLSGGADPLGITLCLMGALALAVATLTLRGASSGGNVLMVVGLQMLVGSVALGVVSAVLETHSVTVTPAFLAAFAYQIFIPGLAATLLWFALVGRIGTTRAAAFHFLNPFFGVAIAAVLLGEAVGMLDAVGVAVTLLFGMFALSTLPFQLFPDIERPQIGIQTGWRSATPREVEQQIVEPEEQVLQGISGLKEMQSFVGAGGAYINLTFEIGTDMRQTLVDVIGRINRIPSLPADSERPVVLLANTPGFERVAAVPCSCNFFPATRGRSKATSLSCARRSCRGSRPFRGWAASSSASQVRRKSCRSCSTRCARRRLAFRFRGSQQRSAVRTTCPAGRWT
ncbi:MAG: EamA family transporter [Rhodobacteraceae bacterium]|nr:EamA family transporter [Paracoccaceae bacterium]